MSSKVLKKMAEIAILMDVDGPENILQLENAYFDTTHTHVCMALKHSQCGWFILQ